MLAEWTGLEPATPGVTGRYSNQLNYHSEPVLTRSKCYFLQVIGKSYNPKNLASPRGFEPRLSP